MKRFLSPTRPAASLLALSLLVAMDAGAAPKYPEPPPGQSANAVIALVRFKRQACDDAASRLVEFWQSTSGNDAKLLLNFVLENLGTDLASARAAADVEGFLLPRTRAEAGVEAQAAMSRLTKAADAICDEVAQPEGLLADFQTRLRAIHENLAIEETELGRLVVLPDAKGMDAAIEPFLEPIQLASLEAAAEYLAFQKANQPKEVKLTLTERMVAWHQQAYLPTVTPIKSLLGRYLDARGKHDGKGMTQACQELNAAVIPVLRHPKVFEAPDPKIVASLKRPYVDIRNLGMECAAGRFNLADGHYSTMQQHLQEAAQALGRYGLRP